MTQDRRPPPSVAATTHILIASMPKSGASFLSDVICELNEFREVALIPDGGRREQELDETRLQKVDGFSYVAHHHVRHSEWTADLCRRYKLRPVVLVRGLFDVVAGLRDHIRREGQVLPTFFAEAHHAALDDATLERMIVYLGLPWCVNFYMGWRQAPDALLIDHDQLIKAPTAVVADILRHAGAHAADADIDAAVRRVIARSPASREVDMAPGRDLGPDAIRKLLELIDLYPEAAGDGYIQDVRRRAGRALPGDLPPAARPPVGPRAGAVRPATGGLLNMDRKTKRLLLRRVIPICLLFLAGLYWLWPNDLIPDTGRIGYLDDTVVLLGFSYLAGWLTKFK